MKKTKTKSKDSLTTVGPKYFRINRITKMSNIAMAGKFKAIQK